MELLHDSEFWFVVCFLVFVALIWKTASKSLGSTLDTRAAKIRDELDEARRLREEAQALVEQYRNKQHQAVKDAAAILDAAKEEAERMRQEGEEDLRRSLAAREAQAQDRIAQAEREAVQAVKTRAVEMAIQAATQLVPETVDQKGAQALIDQAIDDLPRRARA